MDQYDALLDALRATQPEVDHGIRAHQAIALLEQGDVSPTTTQDAIDAVCSSISLQNVDVDLSPMQSEMASRLFAVLDQQGRTLTTLNLDGQRALRWIVFALSSKSSMG